jgi:hypothetical protein
MTCRALLWIAVTAATVGAVAATPSVAGGATDEEWDVTIDEPSTVEVETRHVVVTGTAARGDDPVSVSVTVVPQGLPPACGPELTGAATVSGPRYTFEIDVRCNGPHQIQVVAHTDTGLTSGGPVTRDIGVAERPATPSMPELDLTAEGGMVVIWEPTTDVDTAGTVVRINYREMTFGPGITQATFPPSDRRAPFAVRALRWGAGGPGTSIAGSFSPDVMMALSPEDLRPEDLPDPDLPPPRDPPRLTNPPAPDSGTAPPRPTGRPTPSTDTTSTTTLPPDDAVELTFGAPEDVLVPRDAPIRRSSSDAEEEAVSSVSPLGGLVSTADEPSPGLIAPLAIGVLMITIATHIAWHRRRSRPTVGWWSPSTPADAWRPERSARG